MASFLSFNALQEFGAPARFMERTENGTDRHRLVNIFPPSLETLQILRCEKGLETIVEALEYLFSQDSPQQVPWLKNLVMKKNEFDLGRATWDSIRDGHETALEKLSTAAAAREISIVWR